MRRVETVVNQRGFVVPAWAWSVIGYGLLAAGAVAILSYGVWTYNEWIRAPLKQDIKRWEDSAERNKKEAAALLNAKIAEHKLEKEKSDADAKRKDADYAKLLARLNARGPVGVRDLPAGCGQGSSSAGQAGTDSAGTPEKPTSGSGVGDAGRELVFTEGAVATVLQWYAYGLSCHAFVNQK